MKTLVLVFVVLLIPRAVEAQHPCDEVAPTSYRYNPSQLPQLRLGWCFTPLDVNGFPLLDPVGFIVQINDGPAIDLGVVYPIGSPNADGQLFYEAPVPALTAGVITVRAYTASAGVSAPSDSIALRLRRRR